MSAEAPRQRRLTTGRLMVAPAVAVLLAASVVPLVATLYLSVRDFRLLEPGGGFVGLANYVKFVVDPMFAAALVNTLLLVGGVLAVTLVAGLGLALLLDQPMRGRSAARLLVIAPFFVMPTVSALLWKTLLMNPVSGLFAAAFKAMGLPALDWLGAAPLASIVLIVAWNWTPFATLILLTSLQALDREQLQAAKMDGAGPLELLRFLIVPHLRRSMAVVALVETIFLLSVFAEIYVTTGGGPGVATTNLSFLVFAQALLRFDIGAASAGGVIAVVFANLVLAGLGRLAGREAQA